jgi:hypothetical protein
MRFIAFFTTCFLDIATSLKVLLSLETDWDRIYNLKNGLVTIYESIKTYNKHQKDILPLITKYDQFRERYDLINKNLKGFKKKYDYDKTISNFRNKAGAHYDENFIEYFYQIVNIDSEESIEAIYEFSVFLMSLISFWTDLITEIHEIIISENAT